MRRIVVFLAAGLIIAVLTGHAAPQMELNWCENAVKHEAGEKFFPSSMRRAGVTALASMPHVRASQRP